MYTFARNCFLQRESLNYTVYRFFIPFMESYKFLELFGTGKPNTMGNKLYIIPIYVVFKWGTIDSILQRESFDSDGLNCPLYWNEEAEAMYSLAQCFLQRESFHLQYKT